MNLREALRMALRSLWASKLRSGLTTLGIVIGVSAVIILVGLGNGIQSGFDKSFGALSNQLLITQMAGAIPGGGLAKELTDADVTALRNTRKAPHIVNVTPVNTGAALINYRQNQFRSSIIGSTTDYLEVANRELVAGENFSTADEQRNGRVVILGPDAVDAVFGGDPQLAVGKTVRIALVTFTVVGVVKADGQQDDVVIMPLDTVRTYLLGGTHQIGQIIVKASDVETVTAAEQEVNAILDAQHTIRDPERRDFEVTVLSTLLNKANEFLTYLTLFTIAVAAISLIVGGIGIANIMLVSVTERTHEIGIRKAIGARRSAIMKQFLIESMVLAGFGGVIGIVTGVGVTLIAGQAVPRLAPSLGPPTVSPGAVLVAFGVSVGIGIIAGGYPARRAARLRPIDALRHQ